MKKILTICMVVLAVGRAHATTMCAAAGTLPIVLDPTVAGTGRRDNIKLSEWETEFPYGTLFGIAACVSTSGKTNDTAQTLIDTDTGEIATGGERTGRYCWCKMTHPLQSGWVFRNAGDSTAACSNYCAAGCALYMQITPSYREALFGTVMEWWN